MTTGLLNYLTAYPFNFSTPALRYFEELWYFGTFTTETYLCGLQNPSNRMSPSNDLLDRCKSTCELCSSSEELHAYIVPPKSGDDITEQIAICTICLGQIEDIATIEINHWRCLNDSIWNEVPAVQVMAYRMLKQLPSEEWAQDLLGMIYMEDSTRAWAEIGSEEDEDVIVHKDSNGNILQAGDSVVLIQDLKVKGANFTAKRGTAVRRISLVQDNAEHIEGRVEDQHIVILTKFVKKTN